MKHSFHGTSQTNVVSASNVHWRAEKNIGQGHQKSISLQSSRNFSAARAITSPRVDGMQETCVPSSTAIFPAAHSALSSKHQTCRACRIIAFSSPQMRPGSGRPPGKKQRRVHQSTKSYFEGGSRNINGKVVTKLLSKLHSVSGYRAPLGVRPEKMRPILVSGIHMRSIE